MVKISARRTRRTHAAAFKARAALAALREDLAVVRLLWLVQHKQVAFESGSCHARASLSGLAAHTGRGGIK